MSNPLDEAEMEQLLEMMQRLCDTYRQRPPSQRLLSLVGRLHKEGKRRLREGQLEDSLRRRKEDQAVLASTTLVQQQADLPAALPAAEEGKRRLHDPEDCYVCKTPYWEVHHFYHFLCPSCAEFNYNMRNLHSDLRGRRALVTGGRVKIGHQLVLRLLRDGCEVLVTTRFPHAAAARLLAEPDSSEWMERVHVFGLDLRNVPAVEAFAAQLCQSWPDLDILVHNAAQTISRPGGFYQELEAQEERPLELPAAARARVLQATVAALPGGGELMLQAASGVLPRNQMHDHEERVDQRDVNSWLLPLEDVSAREMLEVQLVNSVAPFLLNARLLPLLERSPQERRFIVNVSAMEGQFSRHKTIFHPHTNMAKAALNMMTHTSAAGYAQKRIYMNSVDTGWVTDENPTPKRLRKQEELGFFAPLDIIDGMARIYHPIAFGVEHPEEPLWGQFLKDYAPCKW